MLFTRRHKLWAGYWLTTAVILGAVVTTVHFIPGPRTETPTVIYRSYGDNHIAGMSAVVITFAIVAALIIMAGHAVWARRRSRRW
jgi:ABC-type spermidine/putrescine transport system permease subunit II